MEWTCGVQYNVAALQAVMAAAIGGDNLHHVAGINPFYQQSDAYGDDARMSSVAMQKRPLCCRWLLIDATFMLPAHLLAEVDCRLRAAVSDACPHKRD